ncbi:putative hydroxymethylpyrimidine transporter CytX [Campylobacter sp. 19-13652]|uniref:putative hydroxymethylpyrimidine transporter CytX n=1 Tax=Campylobacter sp. 19-13652 TaxID=2840180 RepID=UPI001C74281B|nr:putative hydroxymethylpyrimidine transporter CytX [Campylobacter sp. 19-13652]BCX79851.1 hydrogenase expression protein [Campylobacter sp. 19-13652]
MKTSLFTNSIIWFGAAISIAEIITGTYLAPLGFAKGLAAIIIGHIIGCILLFLAGVIGGVRGQGAMDSVKLSFGLRGGAIFAILNIIQLLGWTAIMIYDAAQAANGIAKASAWGWALAVGGLIVLWLLLGLRRARVLNAVAVGGLFILSVVLAFRVFTDSESGLINETISFGAAIELSAAMPLSWLPLISDYTKQAQNPVKASALSALSYGIISCFMYAVGMGAAINSNSSDIVGILLASGLGIWGLVIVVLSTVTTTFLDAYSAGVSAKAINSKISIKAFSVAVAVAGTVAAVCFNMDDITDFLYLIGSVFAPMITILIVDFFILRQDFSDKGFGWINLMIWLAGFLLYRYLLSIETPLGNTLPDMLATAVLCLIVHKIKNLQLKLKN